MTNPRDREAFAPGSPLAGAVRLFCLSDFDGPTQRSFASNRAWTRLRELGTELWLDTGDMQQAESLWCAEFSALTTNNTLLNKEVQKGIYDELVPRAAAVVRQSCPGIGEPDLVLEIAFILNAVHGLELVRRFGARVSVELHTDLAHSIESSVAYALRYHGICPSHFIVKVPLTPAGLVAARRLSDRQVPVNFTLGFSARENLVIGTLARPAYLNVFMGRINAFISGGELGDGRNAGELATQASQAVVSELREQGVCQTRQIGASMRGSEQVPGLAGLDVYTMPVQVASGYLENPANELENRMQAELPVAFNDGIDRRALGLDCFWDTDEDTRRAVRAFETEPVAELDGARVREILAENGAAYLFPELDPAEQQRIQGEGKIPVFRSWQSEVRSGRMAWDSLLTIAGLASFASDQAMLDERIRTQLR